MINFQATINLASHLYLNSVAHWLQIPVSLQNDPSKIESQSTEYLVRNWLEARFAYLQIALLWHDPYSTYVHFAAIFLSIMFIYSLHLGFYTIICMAMFCYNFVIFWFRFIWPVIRVPPENGSDQESRLDVDRFTHLHPNLITLNELGQITENLMKIIEYYINKMLVARRQRPIDFYARTCSILTITAIIGRQVPGLGLILLVTNTMLFLFPKLFMLLSENKQESIKDHFQMIISEVDNLSGTKTTSNPKPSAANAIDMFLSKFKRVSPSMQDESDSSAKKQDICSIESSSAVQNNSSSPLIVNYHSDHRTSQGSSKDLSSAKESSLDVVHKDELNRGSEDLSSNGSLSLIDFEDEQQDDFVIL